MTKSRRDGLYLMMLGIAVFVLFGASLRFVANDSMADFRGVYYGTKCLLEHKDPYNARELESYFAENLAKGSPGGNEQRIKLDPLFIYLPSAFPLIALFALLPLQLASLLWMGLTAACMIVAALLMWALAADYAPILAGGLLGFVLANGAIVVANGNPAGIVVSLCVIGAWCFLKDRFVLAGVLCFGLSLAIKPHDAGLIWLFFLLGRGLHRKCVLLALALTAVLGLGGVLWVAHVAPNWRSEMRANYAGMTTRGGNGDPGPSGLVSTKWAPEVFTNLQAVVSVFRDEPEFYNPVSYAVCGIALVGWSLATARSRGSIPLACFGFAAAVPLSMLVTYHRAYDAKLLMLAIPACAILWAEGGRLAKIGLVVTLAGLVFTGEIPLAILFSFTKRLGSDTAGFLGKVEMIVLGRPATLCLLAMAVFYLWIYVRRARTESPATTH